MAKKKSFLDIDNPTEKSPAMAFITASEKYTDNTDNTHNTHNTDEPRKSETKSRRLNLLLFPSVAEDIEKIAAMRKTSANNLINEILKDYAEENRETVNKYNDVFGGGEDN